MTQDATTGPTDAVARAAASGGIPFAFAFAFVFALAAPALAQRDEHLASASDASPDPRSGHFAGLAPVTITATRSPAELLGVPASVSIVNSDEIAARGSSRIGDAIADTPGVYVRGAALGGAFPASGQAVLSLRGIPRTPRTLVMIDGHPINNALSGGVNVAAIAHDAIGRVEIVRGPYSALYGGAAMGGVVNFVSAPADERIAQIRLGAGNFQQRGGALVYRNRYEGGLGVSFAIDYRESDGYADSDYVVKPQASGSGGTPVTGARPTTSVNGTPAWWVGLKGARPWTQSAAQIAFDHRIGDSTKLVAGLGWARYTVGYSPSDTFLRSASGSPFGVGAATFDDGGPRRISLAASDFVTPTPSGERDLRLFTRVEHRFAGGSVLNANFGILHHEFNFAMPKFGSAGYDFGPGELTDQPNRRVDFDVALRTPMSARWMLTTGVALGRTRLDRSTSELAMWRDDSTRGATLNAGRGTALNTAFFVQSEHDLGHGLSAYLGGRYDRFETSGEVVQNTAPAFSQNYDRRSFDHFSPKIALVWQARKSLSLRASYGQGFRPPALLELYSRTAAPTATAGVVSINEPSPDLRPERVESFDAGADFALAGGARGSLTFYRQRLDDLIYRRRLSPTLTRTQNAAQADVDGVEASLSWPTPWRGLTLFGSLAHQFRYEVTRNDAVPESVGKRLTDVPRTTGSFGLRLDRAPWSGLLVYRYVGRVFGSGDDLNRNTVEGVYGSYDAHAIVSARLAWQIDRQLSLSVAIENLADRQYFVFNKQPGRTVYAELSWRL